MKKEEKKVKERAKPIPIEYKNIDPILSSKICEILESAAKFQMPKGGIHKPMIWKNNKNKWGVLYRTYAIVDNKKIDSIKATKYLALQLKWTARRGLLMPNRGYETLIRPIDGEYSELFQKLKG